MEPARSLPPRPCRPPPGRRAPRYSAATCCWGAAWELVRADDRPDDRCSLHLLLRGLSGPPLPALRAALEGAAGGAWPAAPPGCSGGRAAGRRASWPGPLIFPPGRSAECLGPLLLPELAEQLGVWLLPLMMFVPLWYPLTVAASRLRPPQGAKAQASLRFVEMSVWGPMTKHCRGARGAGTLLAGSVVGLEVGFAAGGLAWAVVGASAGAVVSWLAAVATGWWPRRARGRMLRRQLGDQRRLAALGGLALLWLYQGAMRPDDPALVLTHSGGGERRPSPDASRLLSRDAVGAVNLWDAGTGELRHAFTVRAASAAFSADGRAALLGGEERSPPIASRTWSRGWRSRHASWI